MIETAELKVGIQLVADRCDESVPEQAAIKGVLCSLLGAIAMNEQVLLLSHVCEFSRDQIMRIQQLREAQAEKEEWPDTITEES